MPVNPERDSQGLVEIIEIAHHPEAEELALLAFDVLLPPHLQRGRIKRKKLLFQVEKTLLRQFTDEIHFSIGDVDQQAN